MVWLSSFEFFARDALRPEELQRDSMPCRPPTIPALRVRVLANQELCFVQVEYRRGRGDRSAGRLSINIRLNAFSASFDRAACGSKFAAGVMVFLLFDPQPRRLSDDIQGNADIPAMGVVVKCVLSLGNSLVRDPHE
eukprot:IDg7123t1